MNALIFAAGLGTRLKPLTDTMPKAMVPVNGKPLVQILIEKLKSIGVLIYLPHFLKTTDNKRQTTDNADLLSLYNNATSTTLLVSQRNTQRYLLFDKDDRLVGWTNIATGEVKSPFPEIKALENNCQLSTINCQLNKYAFSGIQVFHPSLLPLMDSWQGKFSIIDFYLSICDKVDIKCHFDPQLQLLDVGKLDSIVKAEEFLAQQ